VNAALAGVTLVASFARFKAPMYMFSEERASSRPFGPRDLSTIVETTKKWCDVQAARKSLLRLIETSVHLDIERLVQSDPFGKGNYLCVRPITHRS